MSIVNKEKILLLSTILLLFSFCCTAGLDAKVGNDINVVNNDGKDTVFGSILNPKDDEVNIKITDLSLQKISRSKLNKLSVKLVSNIDPSKVFIVSSNGISVQIKRINNKQEKYLVVSLFNLTTRSGASLLPSAIPSDDYKLEITSRRINITTNTFKYKTPSLVVGKVKPGSQGFAIVEDLKGNKLSDKVVVPNSEGIFFTEVRANKITKGTKTRKYLRAQLSSDNPPAIIGQEEIDTGIVHVITDTDLIAVVPLDNNSDINSTKIDNPVEVNEASTITANIAKENEELAAGVSSAELENLQEATDDSSNNINGNKDEDSSSQVVISVSGVPSGTRGLAVEITVDASVVTLDSGSSSVSGALVVTDSMSEGVGVISTSGNLPASFTITLPLTVVAAGTSMLTVGMVLDMLGGTAVAGASASVDVSSGISNEGAASKENCDVDQFKLLCPDLSNVNSEDISDKEKQELSDKYSEIGRNFKNLLEGNCNIIVLFKKLILVIPDKDLGKGYCGYTSRESNPEKLCEFYGKLLEEYKSNEKEKSGELLPCPPTSCDNFQDIKPPKCVEPKKLCNKKDVQSNDVDENCFHKPIRDLYCAKIGEAPGEIYESACSDNDSFDEGFIDPKSGVKQSPGWIVKESLNGNKYCIPSNIPKATFTTGFNGPKLPSAPEELVQECDIYSCHKTCEDNLGFKEGGIISESKLLQECHFQCEVEAGKTLDCNPSSRSFSTKCCSQELTLNLNDLKKCLCSNPLNFDKRGIVKPEASKICVVGCPDGFELVSYNDTDGKQIKSCFLICSEGYIRNPDNGICKKKCPEGFIEDELRNTCRCPESMKVGDRGQCVKDDDKCPNICLGVSPATVIIPSFCNLCPHLMFQGCPKNESRGRDGKCYCVKEGKKASTTNCLQAPYCRDIKSSLPPPPSSLLPPPARSNFFQVLEDPPSPLSQPPFDTTPCIDIPPFIPDCNPAQALCRCSALFPYLDRIGNSNLFTCTIECSQGEPTQEALDRAQPSFAIHCPGVPLPSATSTIQKINCSRNMYPDPNNPTTKCLCPPGLEYFDEVLQTCVSVCPKGSNLSSSSKTSHEPISCNNE